MRVLHFLFRKFIHTIICIINKVAIGKFMCELSGASNKKEDKAQQLATGKTAN